MQLNTRVGLHVTRWKERWGDWQSMLLQLPNISGTLEWWRWLTISSELSWLNYLFTPSCPERFLFGQVEKAVTKTLQITVVYLLYRQKIAVILPSVWPESCWLTWPPASLSAYLRGMGGVLQTWANGMPCRSLLPISVPSPCKSKVRGLLMLMGHPGSHSHLTCSISTCPFQWWRRGLQPPTRTGKETLFWSESTFCSLLLTCVGNLIFSSIC